MQAEDIDILARCIESGNYEKLIQLVNKSRIKSNFIKEENEYENIEKIMYALMSEIEENEELMTYFKGKCANEYRGILSTKYIFFKQVDNLKHFIDNRKKYGLDDYGTTELIIATNNKEYIKSCIEDKEKYGLESYEITKLIIATKDKEYIKSCVEDSEKYGLDCCDIIELIMEIKDKEYIKSCIEDKEKYRLDGSGIKELLKAIKDKEYIKSCIEDKEKYGLNSCDVIELLMEIKDKEYIKSYIEDKEDVEVSINLPQKMTIGIEIESEGVKLNSVKELINLIYNNWKCKGDDSLICGIEVVSPRLHADSDEIHNIYSICSVLSIYNQSVSDRCGGHIHIGADFLTSVDAYKNLIEIWGNTELILYIIGNKKGQEPRDGIQDYSAPISKKIQNAMNRGELDLQNEDDLQEFVSSLQEIQQDKYCSINFNNITDDGINTIEFRLPNGTINPDTWIENINLFGGIVKVAEDIAIIKQKNKEERTTNDLEKLHAYESLKSDKVEDKDKLECLLKLVIEENQRQIYRDRYDVNSKLLMQHNLRKIFNIKNQVATGKISFGKKDICRVALVDNNPIRGDEYVQCRNIINNQLKKEKIVDNEIDQ